MATKEVAVKQQSSAVAVVDDDLLNLGTGLEDTSSDDFAIPFLQMLQALSPQLNKNDGKYIKGAEQGNIYNTVTGDVTDGDEGLIVVPCYYNKKYLEWSPRESGGGLVNTHDSRDILAQCVKNDRGQFVLPNQNYIAETAHFYVMICNEDETEWTQAVIAMTSTQLTKARKWVSQMKQRRVQNSSGAMVEAPMFLFKYRLKTVAEQNDRGSWYGWSIGLEDQASNKAMILEGANFLKMIKSGDVQAKNPDADGTVEDTDNSAPF